MMKCGCSYFYECSRCGGCYRHQHKAKWRPPDVWYWRSRVTHAVEPMICEKHPSERGRPV